MGASRVDRLRSEILHAREERETALERWISELPRDAMQEWSLLVVTTSVPGEEKAPAGLIEAFVRSVQRIRAAFALSSPLAPLRPDALGPIEALAVPGKPEDVKRTCVALESVVALGRLADLDVHRGDGTAVRRSELGFPQRTCLVCDGIAWDCMRGHRHTAEEIRGAVASILGPAHAAANRPLHRLAAALVRGAREELDLTPKPGLVDRRDNGSHPDLSHASMVRSIELLNVYYENLIALRAAGAHVPREEALPACIAAGREAEERMSAAIGTNAHRGYIFLSGLVVLAACDASAGGDEAWTAEPPRLRDGVAAWARAFFERGDRERVRGASDLPGERLRREFGLGGIREVSETGLALVLEDSLASLRRAESEGRDPRAAAFLAMARLMQRVEDTTAVHRCGLPGLARIRRDGAVLERMLEAGDDIEARLTHLNDEYRRIGLTMGGVADCLALTLAFRALPGD